MELNTINKVRLALLYAVHFNCTVKHAVIVNQLGNLVYHTFQSAFFAIDDDNCMVYTHGDILSDHVWTLKVFWNDGDIALFKCDTVEELYNRFEEVQENLIDSMEITEY